MTQKQRQNLRDALVNITGEHQFCDRSECDIRRAREDGLYFYAARWLLDATGDRDVRALLKKLDPSGRKQDREEDRYGENEARRRERGEIPESETRRA